jgi:hypothetical protein
MAYHPQSNGTVERLNRTLISMLRTCVCDHPKSWDIRPPEIVFAYNTTPHSSTSMSPYSLVFGTEARLPCELLTGLPLEAQSRNAFVSYLIRRNNEASEIARHVSNATQKTSKEYYDANANNRLFKPGDVVYVRVGQHKAGACNKLAAPWMGPCVVEAAHGVRVTVVTPSNGTIQVHHNRLSRPVGGPAPTRAKLAGGGEGTRSRRLSNECS